MAFPKYKELYNELVSMLESEGLDDAGVLGSVSNLMATSLISRATIVANRARRAHDNAFIQSSSGVFLDLHGEVFGLRRSPEAPAFTLAEDENLYIETNSGTLRERIGTQIAEGTEISSEDGVITYELPETEVPAGVSRLYLTAFSRNVGRRNNVSAGELTAINLPASDIVVNNRFPINNGNSAENSTSYKQRLLNHTRGHVNGPSSVIAIAEGISGVTGSRLIDNAFGISHPALLIYAEDRIGPSIVNRVESVIRSNLPLGDRVRVILPKYKDLDISMIVRVSNAANKRDIQEQIESQVRDLIGNLTPGRTINLNSLDPQITRALPQVIDLDITDVFVEGRQYSGSHINVDELDQLILNDITVEVV